MNFAILGHGDLFVAQRAERLSAELGYDHGFSDVPLSGMYFNLYVSDNPDMVGRSTTYRRKLRCFDIYERKLWSQFCEREDLAVLAAIAGAAAAAVEEYGGKYLSRT